MRLKLDLHDIYNRGTDIDRALEGILDEAERTRTKTVEIIPGKGSGQLKKRVLRFLDRKDIKARYHRVEKDSKNHGRLFVHFKHGLKAKMNRPGFNGDIVNPEGWAAWSHHGSTPTSYASEPRGWRSMRAKIPKLAGARSIGSASNSVSTPKRCVPG